MALIRNGSNQLGGLNLMFGAVGAYGLRGNFDISGKFKNFDSGDHAVSGVTNKNSSPSGARHPYAWKMPTKAGSLASHNETEGSVTATLSMASGRNIAGLAEGTTPTAQATLQLVVSMIASALGEATVSGNLNAALGMSGSASGEATASALINALAWAIGNASGEATASLVSYATGRLVGEVTPFTELSPEGLANAVWDRVIEAGFTAEEIIRIVAAHAAGAATGLEGSDMQFTGLDGSTVRIDGAYSGGTRTIDSLNGA